MTISNARFAERTARASCYCGKSLTGHRKWGAYPMHSSMGSLGYFANEPVDEWRLQR